MAARVCEPKSGRIMEVHTTEPGVQLYTGNFLDGSLTGFGGFAYTQHSGLCLETQRFPTPRIIRIFLRSSLRPEQTYKSTTSSNSLLANMDPKKQWPAFNLTAFCARSSPQKRANE